MLCVIDIPTLNKTYLIDLIWYYDQIIIFYVLFVCIFVFAWPTWVYYANKEQKCHLCPMFCTRDIVRYYFRLYILKWRFNINNLVLNVRLYIQVNFLTSVADELTALDTLPFIVNVCFTEFTEFWISCSENAMVIHS